MKFEKELQIQINDVLNNYNMRLKQSRKMAYIVLMNFVNREFVESRINKDEYEKAVKTVIDNIYKWGNKNGNFNRIHIYEYW